MTVPAAAAAAALGHTGGMTGVTLPCDPTAPGLARRVVARAAREAGVRGEVADSARLITSELVTNAVVHGRSEVRLVCVPDAVRRALHVEVGDDNSRHPRIEPVDDGALDGRGLFIVDLLATRWGVRDTVDGKLVWFDLVDDPDESAADRAGHGAAGPERNAGGTP